MQGLTLSSSLMDFAAKLENPSEETRGGEGVEGGVKRDESSPNFKPPPQFKAQPSLESSEKRFSSFFFLFFSFLIHFYLLIYFLVLF